MKRYEYTPDPMMSLEKNEVFVFGANELGRHGAGSALAASLHFGAVYGEIHRTGRCYGLVTIHFERPKMTKEELHSEFALFFKQVELETEKTFYLTKVGVGLAGWSIEDIKTAFHKFYNSEIHTNVVYPKEFAA